METLKKASIPVTIASSSHREDIEIMLYSAGLIDYFKKLVTIWEVKEPKPAPDVYIEAARIMNTDIKNCIIFEDSYQGIEGGIASGAYTIALTTSYSPAEVTLLEAQEHYDNFTKVDLKELEKNLSTRKNNS